MDNFGAMIGGWALGLVLLAIGVRAWHGARHTDH